MIDFIKRKPMRTFWILIFIIVLALLIIANSADVIHAGTFASKPAACQPGYIVRNIRGGLPRCVRAPYVPTGV